MFSKMCQLFESDMFLPNSMFQVLDSRAVFNVFLLLNDVNISNVPYIKLILNVRTLINVFKKVNLLTVLKF